MNNMRSNVEVKKKNMRSNVVNDEQYIYTRDLATPSLRMISKLNKLGLVRGLPL
jgi:hypothetical protein